MTWKIEIERKFEKNLKSLDKQIQKRILEFMHKRIMVNPRRYGKQLLGDKSGLWRYRVGDYRIICQLKDDKLIIILIEVGHRKDIYD